MFGVKHLLKVSALLIALPLLGAEIYFLVIGSCPAASAIGGLALAGMITVFFMKMHKEEKPHLPKTHFPGLNGLRFFAAFGVIIHHIEQAKQLHGLRNGWDSKVFGPFVTGIGGQGVTLFFVLSGFLITYLLLVEQQHTGTICLKGFYMRRVLRIWPVYFLLTFLSFFLFPHIALLHVPSQPPVFDSDYWPKFALFVAMGAHVSQLAYNSMWWAGVLWSASVEEHFYFIWPLIIRLFKRASVICFLAIIPLLVMLKMSYGIWYFWINPDAPKALEAAAAVGRYFQVFRVDCMAIGGLGAWLCLAKSRLLDLVFHPVSQVILAVALIYCLATRTRFLIVDDDVYALLFLILILNVAINPRSLVKLENPVWDFLGKLSYGLYAYNWIAPALVLNLMVKFGGIKGFCLQNLYIYSGSLGLVLLMAAASYFLMERRFLRLKVQYRTLSRSEMDPVNA